MTYRDDKAATEARNQELAGELALVLKNNRGAIANVTVRHPNRLSFSDTAFTLSKTFTGRLTETDLSELAARLRVARAQPGHLVLARNTILWTVKYDTNGFRSGAQVEIICQPDEVHVTVAGAPVMWGARYGLGGFLVLVSLFAFGLQRFVEIAALLPPLFLAAVAYAQAHQARSVRKLFNDLAPRIAERLLPPGQTP